MTETKTSAAMTPGMTADAKRLLSTTIRALRARLLEELHGATESAYLLSIRARDAGLDERGGARRRRLEEWIREQTRTQPESKTRRTQDDFRREAEKQAAYTLLNRLVILRLMETPAGDRPGDRPAMRKPPVLTGGWESRAYKDFRQLAPALVRGDETEGYGFLLQLVFEELAGDLPGVFGSGTVADLIPIPAGTLRHAIEELDKPELASCWTDDMTLGWVYQYWNDPERERLDDKINPKTSWGSGKIEPHEIASKTQMFTERYMVDWLLQNSLAPMWLAMCKQHGWTAEVEADGTLARLEARRVEWRAKRDAGEVSLTELMPLHSEAERRWAYYVPQPIPDDAVSKAPKSVRELKILDPAVGSGHFLVVAMDLLVALYREEARHRGEQGQAAWSDDAIVERILEDNLHGIDLDPRAVQIAAATLWLKAKQLAADPKPRRMNLVASNLRLGSLSGKDPAVVQLRKEIERETGIPGELTDTIVGALAGADYLGSLLKVDAAVDAAIAEHESSLGRRVPQQGSLTEGFPAEQRRMPMDVGEAKSTILDRLEQFLARHTGAEDLGLRSLGEQLQAGVRFVRMVREGGYDLVVGNPPYQGTSKLAAGKYVEKQYPLGKADLYAAFLLRGLELVRDGGVSAMVTMRNWMFIKQYAELRVSLLEHQSLCALGDVSWGAFREMRDNPVTLSILRRGPSTAKAVAVAPTDPQERVRTQEEFAKKEAGLLCQVGRHEFDPSSLKVVPEWPLVYWWSEETMQQYIEAPKLGSDGRISQGISTTDDDRFFRRPWEIAYTTYSLVSEKSTSSMAMRLFVPLIKGAAGDVWIEPLNYVCRWAPAGLMIRLAEGAAFRSPETHFLPGVAYVAIGSNFCARKHRYRSVCQNMGTSVFGLDLNSVLLSLNGAAIAEYAQSLNPGLHFEVGDARRLPLIPCGNIDAVGAILDAEFSVHEAHREPSVEFRQPGASSWRSAQVWAQRVANQDPGAHLLRSYTERSEGPEASSQISFALGVALGRFAADGSGIVGPGAANLHLALPGGILFLDATLDATDRRDSLGHPASAPILMAWEALLAPNDDGPPASSLVTIVTLHSDSENSGQPHRVRSAHVSAAMHDSLRGYLSTDFFSSVHRPMYENRPIHWPLSSPNRTFVAYVNIHRFTAQTLRILLADHLFPTLTRIEGELTDLRSARDGADKKASRAAAKRYDVVVKARDELLTFIANVEQCADRGPPPPDPKTPPRDVDARYDPDLDDGVMINSAALWPLLEPQWKDPKKWWKELASAKGKQDYDWSHLAMRYWPDRVDAKCKLDPSLGVAHGCFWKYHPARAWAWELRLQQEIGPEHRIEEKPYRDDGGDPEHRTAYLRDHALEALAAVEKEALRRRGRGKNTKPTPELHILESGLWTALPDACSELELRVSEKQGVEFHLRAPDEPTARQAFADANPKLVAKRRETIAALAPPEMFDAAADDDDATDGNHANADDEDDEAS